MLCVCVCVTFPIHASIFRQLSWFYQLAIANSDFTKTKMQVTSDGLTCRTLGKGVI